MSYQPLARKYRPQTFRELVGQEATTLALTNGIEIGREPRAVIFSGVRGVGKTTVARIYAKSLNCENGPTAAPCCDCESCTSIAEGYHEDVLEIDGASNTGVDDVRALRETVSYVPQRSKYRVYIIDEVHMLSQSAFNALLKTLEEPPSHVVFMFATTELQKIPQTIQSRCQVFHLKKLNTETIKARLAQILSLEKIAFEDLALDPIANEGRGSMRDALSLLDQVIALGEGAVNSDAVSKVLFKLSSQVYIDLLLALLERDTKKIIEVTTTIDSSGADFAEVAEELAGYARHAFILKELGKDSFDFKFLNLDESIISNLMIVARNALPLDLNRVFRTLVKCRKELDGSSLDKFIFENYLFEWCLDPGLPEIDTLIANLSEQSSREGTCETLATKQEEHSQVSTQVTNPVNEPDKSGPVNFVFPKTWGELVDLWKKKKPLQARALEEAYLHEYSESKIKISVKEDGFAGKLLQKDVQQKTQQAFAQLFGFKGTFVVTRKESEDVLGTESLARESESLLETKERNKSEQRMEVSSKIKDDPITKEALDIFGGKIEKNSFRRLKNGVYKF